MKRFSDREEALTVWTQVTVRLRLGINLSRRQGVHDPRQQMTGPTGKADNVPPLEQEQESSRKMTGWEK